MNICAGSSGREERALERLKRKYKCTLGDDNGWCDGTQVGSRMRCPRCIRTGTKTPKACDIAL